MARSHDTNTNTNHGESTSLLPDILTHGIHPDGESNRSGFSTKHFFHVLWRSSNKVSQYVNILWPFALAALVLNLVTIHIHGGHGNAIWIFALAYIGMIPAANLLGFAGQEFARKMPKVSGILIETTFGSIIEIVLFLILIVKHRDAGANGEREGEGEGGNLIPIIQAAILGSILTNLLLCLGLCFVVGGLRKQIQTFHDAVSEVGNGLLLVAGFGLLIPSAFFSALKSSTIPASLPHGRHSFTDVKLQHDILGISRTTSILLMIAFMMYIWYNAKTNHSIFDSVLEQDEHNDLDHHADVAKAKFTLTECLVAIAASIALVTVLAVMLVNRIEDVVEAGVPDQFLGLILLPLVEKAAEHLTSIDEAWDGQMNFALYHCLGPSIQTALFNGPLVVVISWALGKNMDLNFEIFMIVLLVLSIVVVGNFLRDGESNALEGGLLVIVYLIIAVAAFYYPNPDVATSNGIEFVVNANGVMSLAVQA